MVLYRGERSRPLSVVSGGDRDETDYPVIDMVLYRHTAVDARNARSRLWF